jgi:hypothetical protein
MRKSLIILFGTYQWKRQLWRYRRSWEDNIKWIFVKKKKTKVWTDLKCLTVGYSCGFYEYRDESLAFLKAKNFLTSLITVHFSRETLYHTVAVVPFPVCLLILHSK